MKWWEVIGEKSSVLISWETLDTELSRGENKPPWAPLEFSIKKLQDTEFSREESKIFHFRMASAQHRE